MSFWVTVQNKTFQSIPVSIILCSTSFQLRMIKIWNPHKQKDVYYKIILTFSQGDMPKKPDQGSLVTPTYCITRCTRNRASGHAFHCKYQNKTPPLIFSEVHIYSSQELFTLMKTPESYHTVKERMELFLNKHANDTVNTFIT